MNMGKTEWSEGGVLGMVGVRSNLRLIGKGSDAPGEAQHAGPNLRCRQQMQARLRADLSIK